MSICNTTDLGGYLSCQVIDIEIDQEFHVRNTVTKWHCTFPSGDFGYLTPGTYIAESEDGKYKFEIA